MILKTERLVLRELNEDDAAFVVRLTNEPSFIANIADKGIRSVADARRFLRDGAWTNQERPGYGQFLVETRESAAAVGICGLLYRASHGLTDVGFAFLPEYWGNGYAVEAAAEMIRYGRNALGVDSIVGLTVPDNTPSIRVLERLGMTFRETLQLADDDPGTAVYE